MKLHIKKIIMPVIQLRIDWKIKIYIITTVVGAIIGADLCNYVHMVFHSINGNDICRLIIMPAPMPVFIKQGGNAKFYIRTGVSTRELNIEEASKFIANRWQK